MDKDYRISREDALGLNPWSIIDRVVYNIDHDCPPLTDDQSVALFYRPMNKMHCSLFSAWMAHNYLAVGGVFYIFENCCKEVIEQAVIGFQYLKVNQIADIIGLACRIFPSGIIPARHETILEYLEELGDWTMIQGAVDRGEFNAEHFARLEYDCREILNNHAELFIR